MKIEIAMARSRSRNRSRSRSGSGASSISLRVGGRRVSTSLAYKSPPPINIPKFKKMPMALFVSLFTGNKEPGSIEVPEYTGLLVSSGLSQRAFYSFDIQRTLKAPLNKASSEFNSVRFNT